MDNLVPLKALPDHVPESVQLGLSLALTSLWKLQHAGLSTDGTPKTAWMIRGGGAAVPSTATTSFQKLFRTNTAVMRESCVHRQVGVPNLKTEGFWLYGTKNLMQPLKCIQKETSAT